MDMLRRYYVIQLDVIYYSLSRIAFAIEKRRKNNMCFNIIFNGIGKK